MKFRSITLLLNLALETEAKAEQLTTNLKLINSNLFWFLRNTHLKQVILLLKCAYM